MNYNTLAIAITDKCDISCGMCCEKEHKYSLVECKEFKKNILDYVKTVKNTDMVKYVALTGGEVFQEKELMKEILKIAKECNKKTSIITNGNWCRDYETALYEIGELKKVGLDTMGISYDSYHKEYVNEMKVINIINACKKVGISCNVQICLDKDTSLDAVLGEIKEYLTGVTVGFVNCMPVGGGKKINSEKIMRRFYDHDILCQKASGFLISYDGKIYPCCSPMAYQLDLDLGNIKEERDISLTLRRLQKNIFLYMLRNYGFRFYIETAQKVNIRLPDKIVSPCEICAIVFSRENIYKFLPYIFEKIKEGN